MPGAENLHRAIFLRIHRRWELNSRRRIKIHRRKALLNGAAGGSAGGGTARSNGAAGAAAGSGTARSNGASAGAGLGAGGGTARSNGGSGRAGTVLEAGQVISSVEETVLMAVEPENGPPPSGTKVE